jgi:hypothetical protein
LEEGDDGLDDEEADEGFMSRWRQGRLKELQNGGYESGIHKSGRTRRSYGVLTTVDGEGYLDAVEKSPAQTVVIVYIYDDMVGFPISPTLSLRTNADDRISSHTFRK